MRRFRLIRLTAFFFLLEGLSAYCVAPAAAEESRPTEASLIEFNRDIRPLLSDACFHCHGPDKARRKADLRLDTEEGAKADLGGRAALVPSDLESSELYQRITSKDPAERMPPPESGRSLTPAQMEVFRRWIEQGATWQKHWSFLAPVSPKIPVVRDSARVRNPIDAFVQHRLEREKVAPAPEADRTSLIRRVTLDLTGLPPTPDEVDAFLTDRSPDAYERVVDRLLASPRFGERMAVRWLDAARYADTSGYQTDGERHMWRWRDWVIEAYNYNLPFDQFTVEQLAGDLLPGATLDQLIASGFNRNHRGNSEGGIIPEEYAVEYVVDRVETTYTVWLGLTMGCVRCHDHKFDPLTQREFYRSFAFFNNVPESGRAIKIGNSPPMIRAPTRDQQTQLVLLDQRFAAAESLAAGRSNDLRKLQAEWERTVEAPTVADWTIERGEVVHVRFDNERATVAGSAADHFEGGTPDYVAGRIGEAARFDGERYVNAGDVGGFGFFDKFSLSAWIYPRGDAGGTIVSRMSDVEHGDGYAVVLEQGCIQVNLVKRWLDDALRVETERKLEPDRWHHVLVTYDGSRVATGVVIFIDGVAVPTRVNLDLLNQTFASKEPLRIGGGNGPAGRFHGLIDDVRVFHVVLDEDEAQVVATAETPAQILAIPMEGRTRAQAAKLQATFLDRTAPAELRDIFTQVVALRRERESLVENFPTTMVMQELPVPRETRILLRGEYDKPGDPVTAGVPGCLPSMPDGATANRLAFARWLVDGKHPLTARVAVNRMWQMLFGIGLVRTVDDFGAQGEWPSHLELLDWLAVQFSALGERTPAWDTKRLLRLIVTSATYRQSSRASPELLQRDSENRLLARGPRVRLSAEMVRDQALFASGMLTERLGGPSVKPYQPAGLWKELADTDYEQDRGASLYRRGMYTFWKRTVPPPTMITFDSAGRETCIVRETRTNTPLQALTLMNDVTFVETSRALAECVMRDVDGSPDERLTRAFRLLVARSPSEKELAVLLQGWQVQRDRFAKSPEAAQNLLKQGESTFDVRLDPAELAAYTMLAGVILNLDETIMKE